MSAFVRPLTLIAVFFAAPAAAFTLGMITRLVGEAALPALLVMVGEPFLWVLMCWLGLYALSHARVLRGLGSLVALVAFAVGLRAPTNTDGAWTTPPEASPALRTCSAQLTPPSGRLRVATFNTAGVADPQALASVVRATGADLVVLQELREPTLQSTVTALSAGPSSPAHSPSAQASAAPAAVELDLPLEGLFVEAFNGAGMGLLARNGVFDVCGGAGRDSWSVTLPAAEGRRAQAALAFPRIQELGSVPLLGVHLDRPAHLSELPTWGPTLMDSSALLAGFARALNNPALVLLGDTNSHVTFPRFEAALRGAGLNAVPARPTWPARTLGLPSLPLYTLDRVWVGPRWTLRELRVQRTDTGSDHMVVVVDLETQG